MKFWLPILAVFLIAGCAAPQPYERFSQVRTGMPRSEIIRLLGEPHEVKTGENFITLEYDFTEEVDVANPGKRPPSSYYIILGKNDRVMSIGTN